MKSQKTKDCRPKYFRWIDYPSRWLVLYHLVFGYQSGIPWCCNLWFCLETLRHPTGFAAKRAGCYYDSRCRADYVHCPLCVKTYHKN